MILPGLFAERIDDDWLARQQLIIEESSGLTDRPLFATIALGTDAVRVDDGIHDILAAAENWTVDGVYLVCEHPRGEYLVTDPNWLANVLDLVAGLRLKGKAADNRTMDGTERFSALPPNVVVTSQQGGT